MRHFAAHAREGWAAHAAGELLAAELKVLLVPSGGFALDFGVVHGHALCELFSAEFVDLALIHC